MSARPRIGRLTSVGGRRVHVREDGPPGGEPVVLLHGFSGSLHWFDRLTPLLADTHRVIRVDLLGHGCTGGHAADADEQARTIAGVLDSLDVADVTAVGHSFGADVAISLAEQSSRVAGLVVVAQAPDYQLATFPPGNGLMTLPLVGPVAHRLAPARVVRQVAAYAFAPGFRLGAVLDRQAQLDHRATDPRMFGVVLGERRERLAARPLDARLRETGLPALAILGAQDRFYGARSAGRYAAAGARVEIIDKVGHSPVVEAPAEVDRILRAFLARGE